MDTILRELLERLRKIGEVHEELYDSEVAEVLTEVIHQGFLKATPGYQVPNDFGLETSAANSRLQTVLRDFIARAVAIADRSGWGFHQRLDAFQDLDVTVGPESLDYNDFFRYTPPDRYDATGEPLAK